MWDTDNGQKYENQYVLKKDIKIPSREKYIDTLDKLLKNNPKLVTDMAEGVIGRKMIEEFNIDVKKDVLMSEFKKMYNNMVKSCEKETLETPINETWYLLVQNFGIQTTTRDALIKELKKQGYDAMVDEASVGGRKGSWRGGVDPLIIFDALDTLDKKVTREISDKESRKAKKEYQKYYGKKGVNNLNRYYNDEW